MLLKDEDGMLYTKMDNEELSVFIDGVVKGIEKLHCKEVEKAEEFETLLTGDDFKYCMHCKSAEYYRGYINGLKEVQKRLKE